MENPNDYQSEGALQHPGRVLLQHVEIEKTMVETRPTQERPNSLDHKGRIARLEGVVEQINVRLGRMETKIDAVDANIDANRLSMEAKVDRLYRWMVPLQITTILAIAGLAVGAFSG